jgi:putative two-component system response regulator
MLAGDGEAGGELAVSASPHVVLIDVDMPYANGYGLFQRLKAHAATRDIPVVFLTADDDVEQRASQLGAAACLKKPLSVERLLKVVGLLTRGAA